MKPFLKWAGNKWSLGEKIHQFTPSSIHRYFEPFLGAGGVLLYLASQGVRTTVIVSDFNSDLIDAWYQVADGRPAFYTALEALSGENSEAKYAYQRRMYNARFGTPEERAARFIYLNKSGFNGLWRMNKKGHFNVPFNRKDKVNLEIANIRRVREEIIDMTGFRLFFSHGDFQATLDRAGAGDFVYLDPPYLETFSNYTGQGFDFEQHKRLAYAARAAAERGATIVCSQGPALQVIDVWHGLGFNVWEITRRTNIAASSASRGEMYEYLLSTHVPFRVTGLKRQG